MRRTSLSSALTTSMERRTSVELVNEQVDARNCGKVQRHVSPHSGQTFKVFEGERCFHVAREFGDFKDVRFCCSMCNFVFS